MQANVGPTNECFTGSSNNDPTYMSIASGSGSVCDGGEDVAYCSRLTNVLVDYSQVVDNNLIRDGFVEVVEVLDLGQAAELSPSSESRNTVISEIFLP